MAGCYRYRAAGLCRDKADVQGIHPAGPGQGVPSGIPAHRQAINRGPGYAGLWDISPAARRESPVPPEGRSDSALPETSSIPTPGADGRTGAGQPIHTRRVQGTHPGSTVWEAGIVARSALQGPHTPLPPILSCWHPGKTGPRRAESRYQGASFADCLAPN